MISLLVLLPLIGAAIALIAEILRLRTLDAVATVASLFTATAVALRVTVSAVTAGVAVAVGGWIPPVGIELRLDGLTSIGVLVVFIIALLIYWYARAEGSYGPHFSFVFLTAVAGMIGLMLSTDLFNMFVFFEILSLSAYLLIAYKRKPRAVYAGFRYLVIGTVGMSLYLLGVFVLYRETGVLSIHAIADAGAGEAPSPEMLIATAAIIAGIGTRVAFFPFHIWLPEAHGEAPHPVSALLSGLMIKAGFLTLFRIVNAVPAVPITMLFEILGPVTAVAGVMLALVQTDMKRLLAFHSVSQMGYILTGFAALGSVGAGVAVAGSLFHMVNHALFKSLLFLTIGIVISQTGKRRITDLAGLGLRMPLVAACFVVGAASISGVPLFNGYVSKTMLSAGTKEFALYPLLTITSIGTVASFIKLSTVFRGRSRTAPGIERVARRMYPPIVTIAAGCVAIGLFPGQTAALFSRLTNISTIQTIDFFGGQAMVDTAIVLAVGFMLYRVVTHPVLSRLVAAARRARLGIEPSVVAVLYGFAGVAMVFMLMAR